MFSFENENINTLDDRAEFCLVVMAGVAQDEVRKLSERLKFGFRQSHSQWARVGNDLMWGYEKKGGEIIYSRREAQMCAGYLRFMQLDNMACRVVWLVEKVTHRKHIILRRDTSLATIRNILKNPNKGWYCGHKTELDGSP